MDPSVCTSVPVRLYRAYVTVFLSGEPFPGLVVVVVVARSCCPSGGVYWRPTSPGKLRVPVTWPVCRFSRSHSPVVTPFAVSFSSTSVFDGDHAIGLGKLADAGHV